MLSKFLAAFLVISVCLPARGNVCAIPDSDVYGVQTVAYLKTQLEPIVGFWGFKVVEPLRSDRDFLELLNHCDLISLPYSLKERQAKPVLTFFAKYPNELDQFFKRGGKFVGSDYSFKDLINNKDVGSALISLNGVLRTTESNPVAKQVPAVENSYEDPNYRPFGYAIEEIKKAEFLPLYSCPDVPGYAFGVYKPVHKGGILLLPQWIVWKPEREVESWTQLIKAFYEIR